MGKLTESQLDILTEYYVRSFDAWETWGDVYEAVKKHGDKKNPIFRALCKHEGTILDNKNNKFVCEMDNKKIYKLFNEIVTNFYIKVFERKKIAEQLNSKYDDEYCIKFTVYR